MWHGYLANQFHVPSRSTSAIKTHVQIRFSPGRSSIMRLLIVATLFLIFSTACASPVYITARGLPLAAAVCACYVSPLNATTTDFLWPQELQNMGLFAKLSHEQFQAICRESLIDKHIIVLAKYGYLARITYEGHDYQLLAFRRTSRGMNSEVSRFKEKGILLGFWQSPSAPNVYDYFVFNHNTFSSKVPGSKKPLSTAVREAAQKSYGGVLPAEK